MDRLNNIPKIWIFLVVTIGILVFLTLSDFEVKYKPRTIFPTRNYQHYISLANHYSKKNGLSTHYFLLADMSVHSGKKRLFLYDFRLKRFTESFLVMHGKGRNGRTSKKNAEFSNAAKSYCTSLGKYIIDRDKKRVPVMVRSLFFPGKNAGTVMQKKG